MRIAWQLVAGNDRVSVSTRRSHAVSVGTHQVLAVAGAHSLRNQNGEVVTKRVVGFSDIEVAKRAE